MNQARSALHKGIFSRRKREYLSAMGAMIRTNKYYKALKKFGE